MKPLFDSTILCGSPTVPNWIVMWGIAIGIYALSKGISWGTRANSSGESWKRVAFLFAWPGMDADTFLNCEKLNVIRPRLGEWILAFVNLWLGLVSLIAIVPRIADRDPYLVGWVGMVGIVFSLHFGLFHLLSLIWRRCGLNAVPIMDWPIASQSLAEFWGRRWNRAFRDLTHRLLFRPLVPRLGVFGSLVAGFLVSGMVHDLVISLPADGGYGGPTGFFLIQSVGMMIERSRPGRLIGLGRGILGRSYCAAFLLAPVALLFHRPFVCNVIVPFLQAIR